MLDVILGLLIVLGWPQTAGWVIGLFLGIELVFAGLSLLLLSHAIRRLATSVDTHLITPGGPSFSFRSQDPLLVHPSIGSKLS